MQVLVVTVLSLLFVSSTNSVFAAGATAKVSITIDDAYTSAFTNALPILSAKQFPATIYVPTSFVGQSGYLNWDQIKSLQNQYNWEIGAHTVDHLELPLLTDAEISYQISQSKQSLLNQGIHVQTFATPFGAYDNRVLASALKYFSAHRGYWDRSALNVWPYNPSVIQVQSVDSDTTLQSVQSWINQAQSSNAWLVLVFHDILPQQNPQDEHASTTSMLQSIVSYISQTGITVSTVGNALSLTGANLIMNGSFEQGLGGWSTDASTLVSVNTNGKGSYPTPKASLLINANSSKSIHAFSEPVTVNNANEYIMRGFINGVSLQTGETGFYIDEYDGNNNWLSGQWMGAYRAGEAYYVSKTYKPASSSVKNARIQIYSLKGSKGKVYVDSITLTPSSIVILPSPTAIPTPTATATPTVSPTFTPTPTIVPTVTPTIVPSPTTSPNLVTNPSFEVVNQGFATSWTKDSTACSVDSTSHGNDGTNSIKITTATKASHLFSSVIAVDPAVKYQWSYYVNAVTRNGEIGFYIDEYSSGGVWISGQWKGQLTTAQKGEYVINYTPTSSNVKQIRLQFYIQPQVNSEVYFDSIKLIKQ
ncbi:polysaccharide deacetylase family protein [candidate division WWE3 bacterium]|nr:polysaccharide deacetylase family protein [candidate division WWE3 bacterium]